MDKKGIIAIVLCVVFLLFWGKISEYLGLVKPAPPKPTPTQPVVVDTIPAPSKDSLPIAQPIIDTTQAKLDSLIPVDTLAPEKLTRVSTPLYDLTFSTHGGGIKDIILKKYNYQGNGNAKLADNSDKIIPDIESMGGVFQGNRLSFECDASDFQLNEGDQPKKLTFTYNNPRGGRIVKSYTITPDRYDFQFDLTIEGIESFGFERDYHLVWGATPPPTEKDIKDDYGYFKVVAMMDKQIELDDFNDGRMSEDIPGRTTWAGLRTKYFTAVMIPQTREGVGATAKGTQERQVIDGKNIQARKLTAAITMEIPSSGNVTDAYLIYVGPIDYKTLKSYNVGLQELTSLGWVIIKPFSIAILWLLPKIYSVIPNYGMVVLIFALLIKIIIYPLTRKQTVAMTKLKDLQPRMKKLQERYKSDPAQLNKEMMKLYKEAGANPLSGCLPLLPQMPLFFALFTIFKTTIEFRGASFMFWITDLSVRDPYFILPIIMVVTMFIQQKMTMTDPKNKMLVYLMPLFFGWLFMNFPAGLVLYWTGFNILSLLETMYIRRNKEAVAVVEGP